MKSTLKIASLGVLLLTSCCCLITVIAIIAAPTIWQKISNRITKEATAIWIDNRSCLADSTHPNSQVTLLKSYVPNKVLRKVNPQFYTYFGYFGGNKDWWRYPLIYPYSIHATNTPDSGYLTDESGVIKYSSGGWVFEVRIPEITKLNLDKNYLLLQIQPAASQNRDIPQPTKTKYAIFTFKTREVSEFASEQAMRDQAKKLHFAGSFKLLSLREYDALFVCQK